MNSPTVKSLLADNDKIAGSSGVYHLLSRIYLREVDAELLHLLRSTSVRQAFVQAGGVLPTVNHGDDEPSVIDLLAMDYCRLFLGPSGHFPPYQSVWQEGQFQGSMAAEMQELVDLLSDAPMPDFAGVMLDHLGVQLAIMGTIAARVLSANSEADRELMVEVAQVYFDRHLTWPHQLLESVHQHAQADFYRSVADLTREFLLSEGATWIG